MKQQLTNARRVLATTAEEPSKAAAAAMPQLTVQIMQKNLSTALPIPSPNVEQLPITVISPVDYGFTVVSQAYTCNLKEGAAVKCNVAITSSSMTNAYRPSADNYLVLSLNTPGQVGCHWNVLCPMLLGVGNACGTWRGREV